MRKTRFWSLNHLYKTRGSIYLFNQSRNIYPLAMAEKFVEHESKRCSKRKRGYSHYQRKNPVAKLPKRDEDDINTTDYYFENGLRKVYPYFYSFSTYVKGRWLGRTIHDVFTHEFKGVQSFQEVIDSGLLTVNNKVVQADFVLKNNQFIEHKTHRHENPVVAAPIEIIADTPDILVINKPSSIPVHPCGRYRYNSITMILWKEYGYKNLRTLYRLDRLTSGILILPKMTAVSVKLEKQLASKQLLKEYVARVEGEFPEETIECTEAISQISLRMGVNFVTPNGRDCHTTFTRLSYNGRTSVVKCVPHTGRTHQIRVHLQFLGYPILNDPIYNCTAFGPDKGKGGKLDKTIEELEEILAKWHHNSSEWVIGENPEYFQKFPGDTSTTVCDKPPTSSGTQECVTTQPGGEDTEVSDKINPDVQSSSDASVKSTNCEESSKTNKSNNAVSNTDTKDDTAGERVDGACVDNSSTDHEHKGQSCDDQTKDSESLEKMETDKSENGVAEKLSDPSHKTSGDVQAMGSISESLENNKTESSENNVVETQSDAKTCSKTSESNIQLAENKPSNITESETSEKCVADVESGSSDNTLEVSMPVKNWEGYVASRCLDKGRYSVERGCDICKTLYKEPTPQELILFLHACRYKGPDWEYSTSLPDWAEDDWADEDKFDLNAPPQETQGSS